MWLLPQGLAGTALLLRHALQWSALPLSCPLLPPPTPPPPHTHLYAVHNAVLVQQGLVAAGAQAELKGPAAAARHLHHLRVTPMQQQHRRESHRLGVIYRCTIHMMAAGGCFNIRETWREQRTPRPWRTNA